MEITFFGAAQTVTGSCTILKCKGKTILIDFGLPQGTEAKRMGKDFPFRAEDVDIVLLTHAHIDHCGRLPLLSKKGFKGQVFATQATADLCSVMLPDSAHIQENDAQWQNKKLLRAGKKPIEPLYTAEDAQNVLKLFCSVDYNEHVKLGEGLEVCFFDAGHMLGSSFIELDVTEEGKTKKLVFSGDIGNLDQPIINDPVYLKKADYVVMESTYGDRMHENLGREITTQERADELKNIIFETFKDGGNVIIPSFSVGRTQEVLYLLRHIVLETGVQIPVFLDSPLSVKATQIFSENVVGYYDEEAMEIVKRGENPLLFPSLVTVEDSEDSKALNYRSNSSVIISSSGMCEAGRIRHHLKHNLWRRECSIVFTGYQAEGTLGRRILDGKKHVSIFGEQIAVRAKIYKMESISGHADQAGLVKWISNFKPKPKEVFVIHGDQMVAPSFASILKNVYEINSVAPQPMDSFTL